jgi:hypothetical protein
MVCGPLVDSLPFFYTAPYDNLECPHPNCRSRPSLSYAVFMIKLKTAVITPRVECGLKPATSAPVRA